MTQKKLNELFGDRTGLRGTDWSHHQKMTLDGDISDFDFFIHKLSEGATYKDPMAQGRILRHCSNKPCIVYHFMRTDKASGLQNYKCFKDNLKGFFGCHLGLALDLETDGQGRYCPATPKSKEDVKAFAEAYAKDFDKPLIVYCGVDHYKYFKDCFKGCPVVWWGARWSKTEPKMPWLIWQFADKPYDLDVFKGGISDFVALLNYITVRED